MHKQSDRPQRPRHLFILFFVICYWWQNDVVSKRCIHMVNMGLGCLCDRLLLVKSCREEFPFLMQRDTKLIIISSLWGFYRPSDPEQSSTPAAGRLGLSEVIFLDTAGLVFWWLTTCQSGTNSFFYIYWTFVNKPICDLTQNPLIPISLFEVWGISRACVIGDR